MSLWGEVDVMTVRTLLTKPLGLFPDRSAPRLYDRMVEVLRVRHYNRRTEEVYEYWLRRFTQFQDCQHPRQLAEGDVNLILSPLVYHAPAG
jgi:hypothetical protein